MLNIFKRKPFSHIQLGRKGEAAAVRLFKARNCVILARNWRNNNEHDGIGELDIVLLDGETLVFAEVKTRRKLDKYLPGTNLSDAQKKRIPDRSFSGRFYPPLQCGTHYRSSS